MGGVRDGIRGSPADEQSVQRISLSLTASYAPAWGLWEGIRELVQNWHDGLLSASAPDAAAQQAGGDAPLEFSSGDLEAGTRFDAKRNGRHVGWCEYVGTERKLVLVNRDVGLGRQVLLLGYSKKAQHQDVIGSFGEGLKVGAIALLRSGLRLRMLTKAEVWTFELAVDPAFGERVLTVEAAGRPQTMDLEMENLPAALAGLTLSDTATVLEGVEPAEWALLSHRFLFLRPPEDAVRTEVGRLLLDTRHAGDFFVRGVWINKDPDLAAGVDLFDIRLDRDRAAVLKKSDLQHQVSSMWVRAVVHRPDLQERYYNLLESDRQYGDTALADLYCDEDTAEAMAAAFRQRHGNAIPVSLKDSNSAKVQQIRTALGSTVVCSQALLAVLRKGGVRCDLDSLLQESELRARRFVPLADLGDDEAKCLAQACELAQLADPSASSLLGPSAGSLLNLVDVFESTAAFSLEGMAAQAEAFATSGRVEVDRRALDPTYAHTLITDRRGLCDVGGLSRCWCRQSLLAFSLHTTRTGEVRQGALRLTAQLAASRSAGPGAEDRLLRCPHLGRDREEALRQHIHSLEHALGDERTSQAGVLQSLQRRVEEAEKELRQAEFKFMDASEARRSLQQELEPELRRLQEEAAKVAAAECDAALAREQAAESARQAAFQRQRADDLAKELASADERDRRGAVVAEQEAAALRRALAQRRLLLQKMMVRDPTTPLIALAGSEEFLAAVEEICAVLREEARGSQCCVCVDAAANTLLLPCRHQQFCGTCAAVFVKCPVCRAVVESRMQVYA